MQSQIRRIRYSFLLLFTFTLPFLNWDPLGISSSFTVVKFFGLIYFLFSLTNISYHFSLRNIKYPLFILFFIWAYLAIQAIFIHWPGSSTNILNFSYLQNIALFWLVSNDLIHNKGLSNKIVISLICGVLVMFFLITQGIGIDSEISLDSSTVRLSFFGSNPNSLGNYAATSLSLIVYMLLNRQQFFGKFTWVLLVTIPIFLFLIGFSGSRGALLITIVGILPLFIMRGRKPLQSFIFMIVGVFVIYLLIEQILSSDIMQKRVVAAIEEGSLGGREEIWRISFDIFNDYPLGVGQDGLEYLMAQKLGASMDTHNLFIFFLVTAGIIGFLAYLIYAYILLRKSFFYYKQFHDPLLLSLMMIYLILALKTGGAINSKFLWLIAAVVYGLGTTPSTTIKINHE